MTEARRRASQAYKERQEREGIKVVSFRLTEYARAQLALYAAKNGVSKNEAAETVLRSACGGS